MPRVALVLACLCPWPALAEVRVDYAALGSFTKDFEFYANCGVIARSSADLLVNAPGAGLAVAGGSDTAIDAGEWVTLEINENGEARTARHVTLEVAAEPGGDGDATAGEIRVEATGPDDLWLGEATFSGEGVHDVSAAFGGQQIGWIRVNPDPDPVRVLAVGYELPAPGVISARFYDIGAFQLPTQTLCGVTLSGSDTLDVSSGGVGVVGPSELQSDNLVDVGEVLVVELDTPTAVLRRQPWSGLGNPVRFSLQGYDAAGLPLSSLPVESTGLQEIDVTALYAGAVLSGFAVTAGDYVDGAESLGAVSYAVPEPGRALAGAAAAFGLAVSAASRRRA